MEPIYIRTDKNGTKIYHDWTCPRCGGAGMCDKWINTGRVCYACGGSGKRVRAKIVKEYSPEYWAKLDAKRKAKAAQRIAEEQKYAKEHPEEIEAARRNVLENRYAENGCGKDGIGYVLKGNTYPVKDQIRKAGGKWIYGCWICPVKIEGLEAHEINLAGHIGSGSMVWLDDFNLYDEIHK